MVLIKNTNKRKKACFGLKKRPRKKVFEGIREV